MPRLLVLSDCLAVLTDIDRAWRSGPDLSSHDGLYELHGNDLTSDAE